MSDIFGYRAKRQGGGWLFSLEPSAPISAWQPLYSHPLFTPSERQYLLRLLGGSLDGGEGMTALGVLELRKKIESVPCIPTF